IRAAKRIAGETLELRAPVVIAGRVAEHGDAARGPLRRGAVALGLEVERRQRLVGLDRGRALERRGQHVLAVVDLALRDQAAAERGLGAGERLGPRELRVCLDRRARAAIEVAPRRGGGARPAAERE